jgi:hypothetical protein
MVPPNQRKSFKNLTSEWAGAQIGDIERRIGDEKEKAA